MKYLAIFLLVVLFSANAFSQGVAKSSIAGTGHDFSQNSSWNLSGEICMPCHTPHNSKDHSEALWNHAASPDAYTAWETKTVNDVVKGDVGEVSKKCLDCHDGQIALAAFGTNTSGSGMGSVPQNLGTDLTNDHPINVAWRTTTTNDADPTSTVPVNKFNVYGTTSKSVGDWVVPGQGTKKGALRLTSHVSDRGDTEYRVDCTTCHTPHGRFITGSTTVKTNYLLRMENTKSALCQSCHQK